MSIIDEFAQRYNRLPTEQDPDYLEMLRMSKYLVLDAPNSQPGKCANCGASKNDGRKYVDFGLRVDWYGNVLLCTICLADIGRNSGLFKDLETKILELELELKNFTGLQEQGEQLHDVVLHTFEEIKEYYAGLHSISDNSPPDNPSDSEPQPPEPAAIESGISKSESGTTKSTDGSRRQNVRSLTDLLNESK